MLTGSKRLLAVALFTLLLIVAVNLVWWSYYRTTERMLEHSLAGRLVSVARSTSANIGPGETDSLVSGDVESFSRLLSNLGRIAALDSLSELFILDPSYSVLVSSSPTSDSVYFLAELNSPYLDSLIFGLADGIMTTPTYKTGDLYLKSAFAPLKGTSGSIEAILGVEANVDYFRSLSDLKRNLTYATAFSLIGGFLLGGLFLLLQRRLNLAEERLFLGQTHAYLGRMVAVVAHEVRNPLMIIRASAERLVKKTGAEEAHYMVEETDRLNDIVSGYLDFARSQGSLLTTDQPEPINLAEFLDGIRRHIEQRFDGQVQWIDSAASPLLTIVGHRRSLRQVIFNLLLNGAESCQVAGKPVLLGLSYAEHGDRCVITVSDRGPGIPKKELKKLFTPFFTTKQSGSGLGLYLSRRIVLEMNGDIRVESRIGTGTDLCIELPKEPNR
jgi:signal transduction histidine kinase